MSDINSLVYVNRTFSSWQEVEDLFRQLKQDFFAPLCRKTTSIKAHNEKVNILKPNNYRYKSAISLMYILYSVSIG